MVKQSTSPMLSETVVVKPSRRYNRPALEEPTLQTHGLDNIGGPVHISNHRFFRKPLISFDEIVTKLRSSLSEALELYPPVAGTIRFNDEMEFVLTCDDEGAIFIVEKLDTPFSGDSDIISPRPVPLLQTPAKVLAVKITQFSCGTIAVGTSMHHIATDLTGFVNFLHLWSKLSRSETVDLSSIPTDWSHTPSRFFTKPTDMSPPPPTGYQVLPAPPTEAPLFLEAEAQNWLMTSASLAKLKKDLTPQQQGDWISSGDAIAALLWGVITRARETTKIPRTGGMGRSSEESGVETIAMAADGRERSVNKKMVGTSYFGNFNLLFQTTCSRSDLLSLDPRHASRVALALRRSIVEQLSAESIPNRIRFFENPENTKPPGRIIWSADTIATNWSKSDLEGEEMSFGFGRPFETTSGGGPFPGGFFRIVQKHGTGDLSIIITVEKPAGEAMRKDELFIRYAAFKDVVL